MSRRAFVGTLAAALPIIAAPRRLFAETTATRALKFTHTHTGERLAVEYFDRGEYLPDALSTINHFLRDFRTGDVHVIDADLLDLLDDCGERGVIEAADNVLLLIEAIPVHRGEANGFVGGVYDTVFAGVERQGGGRGLGVPWKACGTEERREKSQGGVECC